MRIDPEATRVLDRFTAGLTKAVPLDALWAHGSLALGDYQRGRSDLDLIALLRRPLEPVERAHLERLHRTLHSDEPLAAKLHCSYIPRPELAAPERRHLTWAYFSRHYAPLFERPVSPVTHRELTLGGLTLHGPAPHGIVPEVTDAGLAAFVRADLRDTWLPVTAKARPWLTETWATLAPVTFARASVTLDDGRLISKGEALDVLAALGAPPALIEDIRSRRYDPAPRRASPAWRLKRARLARAFVGDGIRRLLHTPEPPADEPT